MLHVRNGEAEIKRKIRLSLKWKQFKSLSNREDGAHSRSSIGGRGGWAAGYLIKFEPRKLDSASINVDAII